MEKEKTFNEALEDCSSAFWSAVEPGLVRALGWLERGLRWFAR